MHSCGWLLYVLLFACGNPPLLVRSALVVCRHGCLIQTVTLSSRLFVALLVPPNNCPPALVTTTATFFLFIWFLFFFFVLLSVHLLYLHFFFDEHPRVVSTHKSWSALASCCDSLIYFYSDVCVLFFSFIFGFI